MKNIFYLQTISLFLTAFVFAQEVARVNNTVITNDQVNARYAELTKQSSIGITRKFVIEDLIKRELAVQEARRLKLDHDPAVLDRVNTVLFYSLIEKKLSAEFDKVRISDTEAKAWYDKNPEVRTSQIFIALPINAKPEDEKRAVEKLNAIYRDIKSGKPTFGEAAQQSSEDITSSYGGDMDYRMKNQLDPAYYRMAVKLDKPGEISTPVRLASGIALVRLTGKHSWLEVDRSAVKRVIDDEKRQAAIEQYLNGLRQRASISVK